MQRVEFLIIISFVGVLIASGSLALIYAEPHVSEPYVLKTPPPAPDTYLITFTGETRIQSGTNKYQGVATISDKILHSGKDKIYAYDANNVQRATKSISEFSTNPWLSISVPVNGNMINITHYTCGDRKKDGIPCEVIWP